MEIRCKPAFPVDPLLNESGESCRKSGEGFQESDGGHYQSAFNRKRFVMHQEQIDLNQ